MAVYSLKGVADLLGSDEIVPLHDTVIMAGDACTNLVQRAVYFTGGHALADGMTALGFPETGIDGNLAAEL